MLPGHGCIRTYGSRQTPFATAINQVVVGIPHVQATFKG